MSMIGNFTKLYRKKLFLGVIFIILVTYSLFILMNNQKDVLLGNDFDDLDALAFKESEDDIFSEDYEEEKVQSSDIPLLWQMEVLNDAGNVGFAESLKSDDIEKNETSQKSCRNSIQGKSLIVDDKGYICNRTDLLSNGCCNIESIEQNKNQTEPINSERFSCETCNSSGCCTVYENCVSCCLNPNKYRKKIKNTSDNTINQRLKKGDLLKYKLRNLDNFQLCLTICRTSSISVEHENTYKDPVTKHCYILHSL